MTKYRGTVLRYASDGDTGLTLNVKQTAHNKTPIKGQLAVVRVWFGTCKTPAILGGYCNRENGLTVYVTDYPQWMHDHTTMYGQLPYSRATIDFV